MRPRYLVLTWSGDGPVDMRQIAARTGLRVAHTSPTFAVFVNEACRCLEVDAEWVVVGTLFHRHGPARPISQFSDGERTTLSRDGSAALLQSYWGGYLTVRARPTDIEVLRDPSAALPCYRARCRNGFLFASDVALLVAAGGETDGIAWDALGRALYASGFPTDETALDGIGVLLPGGAVTLQGEGEHSAVAWSPWTFVEAPTEQPSKTIERLRRSIDHCITAWSSLCQRPLVSLSGGLDSSIVAACLAGAHRNASCITMYTDDPAGDERRFAQAICRQFGLPLTERRYDLDAVDLGRALGSHLPYPIGRAEAQPYEKAHAEVAADLGSDAFFSGNGGDNVFAFSQSAAALADRALHEGPGAGAFATLRDICRHTGAGPLRVTRAALRIARQPSGYRWKPSLGFLHPELVASLHGLAFSHPWLAVPPGALPGKAAHIAGLLRAHRNLESDRSRIAHLINPLLSQPILEVCLSIPTWQWRDGGRDRAAARTAFADRIPAEILTRKVKGTPDPFCGEIIRQKREELRERLLDGQLSKHGILDRGAVEEALRPGRLTTGEENVRLLELVNAEAWITAWASLPRGCDPAAGSSDIG